MHHEAVCNRQAPGDRISMPVNGAKTQFPLFVFRDYFGTNLPMWHFAIWDLMLLAKQKFLLILLSLGVHFQFQILKNTSNHKMPPYCSFEVIQEEPVAPNLWRYTGITLDKQYGGILWFCCAFLKCLKVSHHALQLFGTWLRRLFPLKLQQCLVD